MSKASLASFKWGSYFVHMPLCVLSLFWVQVSMALMPSKAMLIEAKARLWPQGIIPYQMDNTLSAEKRLEILYAMRLWERQTVIQFLPLTPENQADYQDYILFQPTQGKSCASAVGRIGGVQTLRLASRCHTMMIAHELGHVIGLWHEQARWDRDRYIDVAWENIRAGHDHNFNRRLGEGQDLGPYDYDSIMHYSAFAFSKNGKPTLVPKVKWVQIGQRTHLSVWDIVAVNTLYTEEARSRYVE